MSQKAKAKRTGNSLLVQSISKSLKKNLRADRRQRLYNTSVEIESDLNLGHIIGAYERLRSWYKKFTKGGEKLTRFDLETHRIKYQKVFTTDNLEQKLRFPIYYEGPFVPDNPPDEDEIRSAIYSMKK